MTPQQFRIFHPVKPKKKSLTLSEKMSNYSLVFSISLALLFLGIEKIFLITIHPILIAITLLGFLIHLASMFVRLNEYEILDGYFQGQLILNNEYISVNDHTIILKEIVDLKIFYFDYSGQKTKNYRYGPMYTNGIGNQICIKTSTETFECYFEICSEVIVYKIEQYLYSLITNKKIPLTKNHLELVPESMRDYKAYQALLENQIPERDL